MTDRPAHDATDMVTTTNYGTWCNRIDQYSTGLDQTVYVSLGDYTDDYDLDALTREYRAAINDALPPHVTLTGDEFIGPAYDKDIDWTGYPVEDVPAGLEDEVDAPLDIKAIIDSIDFWEIAARHELWTAGQVAEHLGYQGASAAGSARKALSRLGVKATYRPHPESGRPQARYNAHDVQAAAKHRPGQGVRTDRQQ